MSYSIGEAARRCDLPPSTLRYYEQESLVEPERTASGLRRYSDEDVQWLQFIDHMRSTGMSIADLKRYVHLRRENPEGAQLDLLEILRRHEKHLREKLAHYEANLELVHYKIGLYESELADVDVDLFELYKQNPCSVSQSRMDGV